MDGDPRKLLSPALGLAWALLLLPAWASAQTEVDRTLEASVSGRVQVENVSGSVVVTGWKENQVRVTGTVARGGEVLEVEREGDLIEIRVEPHRNGRHGTAHLEIRVPRGSTLDVETVTADITVSEVDGELDLSSVSGEVVVEEARGPLEVETVSGEIDVRAAQDQVSAESVSGQITIGQASDRVDISSVSGRIEVRGDRLARGDVETVSARIEMRARLAPGGELSLSSHSGNIDLAMPGDTSARVSVESYSGRIRNALGPPAKRVGRFGPQQELNFTLGAGEGRVNVETFSGQVSLEDLASVE